MDSIEPFTREPRIAYFSMEIALRLEIPTYSGGLGVLAGILCALQRTWSFPWSR